jgi:hypothetical protein
MKVLENSDFEVARLRLSTYSSTIGLMYVHGVLLGSAHSNLDSLTKGFVMMTRLDTRNRTGKQVLHCL